MAHSRKIERTRLYRRAVLASVAFSSVLVARSAAPSFPRAPLAKSSTRAITHHDERPRLVHNRAQWRAAEDTFLLPPPVLDGIYVDTTWQLTLAGQLEGLHYNRPPPLRCST
jgi:hypothetical protein